LIRKRVWKRSKWIFGGKCERGKKRRSETLISV